MEKTKTSDTIYAHAFDTIAIALGCIGVVVAALGLRAVMRESARGWSVERLEQAISAEIPPIRDRSQAEEWLKARGIQSTYFTDTAHADQVGHSSIPTLAGLKDQDLSGMVRGSIDGEQANVGLFSNGHIGVYFFFDHEGRCVGHWIEPLVYSL